MNGVFWLLTRLLINICSVISINIYSYSHCIEIRFLRFQVFCNESCTNKVFFQPTVRDLFISGDMKIYWKLESVFCAWNKGILYNFSKGRQDCLQTTSCFTHTRKIAALRAAFSSSCGGLHPSAAPVRPFGTTYMFSCDLFLVLSTFYVLKPLSVSGQFLIL